MANNPSMAAGPVAQAYQDSWYVSLPYEQVRVRELPVANGMASAPLALTLPANALVRELTLKVMADRANWTSLGALGQVRVQDSSTGSSSHSTRVVVDFGTPRTVSAVAVLGTASYQVSRVLKWKGNGFDNSDPVWPRDDGSSSLPKQVSFPEISTERLQIEISGTASQSDAEGKLAVQLPALPADLEIRINGGPPVWSSPGPGRANDGWATVGSGANASLQKVVSLTEAVAGLLGNPDSTANVVLNFELRARIPGQLGLSLGTQTYDFLHRIPLPPDGKRDLVFDTEGEQDIPLEPLPGQKKLKEVRLTVVANPPKERAEPAVGPTAISQVELVLDSGRSACVRIPEGKLAELTALRLPLRAQAGGAEVRAQLLASVPGGSGGDEPGAPLDGLSATRPVTLDAPAEGDTSEGWTFLSFDKPVALKGAVWVSLQVSRGKVRWSLGQFDAGDAPYPVRRGAPTGPWVPLPEAVTHLGNVGGRLHAIGHAPKATPLAPLQLQAVCPGAALPAGSVPLDVNPSAKGVKVTVTPQPAGGLDVQGKAVALRVTSRSTGTVTVQELVTVVSK